MRERCRQMSIPVSAINDAAVWLPEVKALVYHSGGVRLLLYLKHPVQIAREVVDTLNDASPSHATRWR